MMPPPPPPHPRDDDDVARIVPRPRPPRRALLLSSPDASASASPPTPPVTASVSTLADLRLHVSRDSPTTRVELAANVDLSLDALGELPRGEGARYHRRGVRVGPGPRRELRRLRGVAQPPLHRRRDGGVDARGSDARLGAATGLPWGDGGSVFAYGHLTAIRVAFEANAATLDGVGRGGAVALLDASARFEDCLFLANAASGDGGAVFVSSGDATFIRCSFERNDAKGLGAGVAVDRGVAVVRACVFAADNTAREANARDVHVAAPGGVELEPFEVWDEEKDSAEDATKYRVAGLGSVERASAVEGAPEAPGGEEDDLPEEDAPIDDDSEEDAPIDSDERDASDESDDASSLLGVGGGDVRGARSRRSGRCPRGRASRRGAIASGGRRSPRRRRRRAPGRGRSRGGGRSAFGRRSARPSRTAQRSARRSSRAGTRRGTAGGAIGGGGGTERAKAAKAAAAARTTAGRPIARRGSRAISTASRVRTTSARRRRGGWSTTTAATAMAETDSETRTKTAGAAASAPGTDRRISGGPTEAPTTTRREVLDSGREARPGTRGTRTTATRSRGGGRALAAPAAGGEPPKVRLRRSVRGGLPGRVRDGGRGRGGRGRSSSRAASSERARGDRSFVPASRGSAGRTGDGRRRRPGGGGWVAAAAAAASARANDARALVHARARERARGLERARRGSTRGARARRAGRRRREEGRRGGIFIFVDDARLFR